jgi:hypothetical protein
VYRGDEKIREEHKKEKDKRKRARERNAGALGTKEERRREKPVSYDFRDSSILI